MNNEIPDLRPNPAGDAPCVDSSVYIDPTAQVIGNVRIGAGTFVGPTAVLRADEADADGKVHPILIGPGANVQDVPTDAEFLSLVRMKLAVPGNDAVNVSDERHSQLRKQLDGRLKPVLRQMDFDSFDLDETFAVVAKVAKALLAR